MAAPGILARLAGPVAGFVMVAGMALGASCASAPPASAPPRPAASAPAPGTTASPSPSRAEGSSSAPAVAPIDSAASTPFTGSTRPIPVLELIDVVILPPGDMTVPRERRFGSLSGLVRDERTGRYLAVIDDRLPARVTWLDIKYIDGRLTVTPLGVEPLTAGPGVDPRVAVQADLEAVVALPDGTFVGSEEGHLSRGEADQPPAGTWPVALLTLSPTMAVTAVHPWPAAFNGGPEAGGIRNNQGAEALTRTPDGRLIAGLERPLFADQPGGYRNGRPFTGGQGGPGRLVEFVASDGRWEARRQWMYPIEPHRNPRRLRHHLRRRRERPHRIAGAGRHALPLARTRVPAEQPPPASRGTRVTCSSWTSRVRRTSPASPAWRQRPCGAPPRRCSSTSTR